MARLYLHPWLKGLVRSNAGADRALRAIEVAIVGAVWAAARRVSVERASDLGAVFGGFVGPRLRKHRHVLHNLEIAFPERDRAWIRATARDSWRQIGRVLAEYPHIDALCRTGEGARVTLDSEVPLERFRQQSLGHVFLAMHQANWNLPALAGALGGFPLDVVYAEQKHGPFEKMIADHRNRMPCGFIHVDGLPRQMIDALRRGRSVGLFVDHRIDQGDAVPFFGHDAQTTTIPARLAHKLGTGLVPTRIVRRDGVRFHISLGRPIYADKSIADTRSAAIQMMREVHEQFEDWVRARPDEWCCVKRRWPKNLPPKATPRVPPRSAVEPEIAA